MSDDSGAEWTDWIPWDGKSDCPVPLEEVVICRLPAGSRSKWNEVELRAGGWVWNWGNTDVPAYFHTVAYKRRIRKSVLPTMVKDDVIHMIMELKNG